MYNLRIELFFLSESFKVFWLNDSQKNNTTVFDKRYKIDHRKNTYTHTIALKSKYLKDILLGLSVMKKGSINNILKYFWDYVVHSYATKNVCSTFCQMINFFFFFYAFRHHADIIYIIKKSLVKHKFNIQCTGVHLMLACS